MAYTDLNQVTAGTTIAKASDFNAIGPLIKKNRVYDTLADAKAETVGNLTDGDRLYCLGYTTVRDGGAKLLRWDANSSATADEGAVVALGSAPATGRLIDIDIEGGNCNVRKFGAKGDGSNDDTAAIQAAIDHAETSGATTGGAVFFPRGSYLYSALTVDSSGVQLVGNGDARLLTSGATGNGITFAGASPASLIFHCVVKGLVLGSNVTRSAGALLYCTHVGNITLDNIKVLPYPAPAFDGIYLTDVNQSVCTNLQIQDCVGQGFYADTSDLTLSDCYSNSNGTYGFHLDNNSGIFVDSCQAYNNDLYAWYIGGAGPQWHHFVNCVGDTSGLHNWVLTGVKQTRLVSCWGSTQQDTFPGPPAANQYGFRLEDCENVHLTDCIAISNSGPGLVVTGNSVVKVSEGDYSDNGHSASSTFRSGIHVAAGCSVDMTNVLMEDTVTMQQHGITVESGVDRITMVQCQMLNNVTAPYSFAGVPTIFRERDNTTGESTTVASASTVALPMFGDWFELSGTTGITAINSQWAGRMVDLIFQGALTVTAGGNLKLASNFSTSADDILSLRSNGTNWYERTRSANA